MPFDFSDAFVVDLPAIVKARGPDGSGRRILEVEASCEVVDREGDAVLQRALLDDARNFIARGTLDIDHISELGPRLGVRDHLSYVVGRPLEVRDLGERRTGVVGEVLKGTGAPPAAGVLEWRRNLPCGNRCDALWDSLQKGDGAWYASIYGFPKSGMLRDCSRGFCPTGATNTEIHGIHWKSLALTRMPQNMSLGKARVVLAKARLDDMLAHGTRRKPVVVTDPAHMELAGERAAKPTPAQAAAGNYPLGHAVVGGLDVSIETPMGRLRSGVGRDGVPWSVRMPVDYGYVKRTRGADGDHVDVYVGPEAHRAERHPVWVVDQVDDDGAWDEHKALVGFVSEEDARRAYYAAFSDGRGPQRLGALTELSFHAFRDWLDQSDTSRPISYAHPVNKSAMASPMALLPDSMERLWALRTCPRCEVHKAASLVGYRRHFMSCAGMSPGWADVCAHALMHRRNMDFALPLSA